MYPWIDCNHEILDVFGYLSDEYVGDDDDDDKEDCYDCGIGSIFHNKICLYEGQGLSYNGDFDDMELCSGENCEFYLS